jgi:plasmid maintenance system antidote protein VapI
MKNKLVADIPPGEILAEEFLKPMGISQYRLALDIGVPPRRIIRSSRDSGRSRPTLP